MSQNVIAEIKGREKPDEIVLLGAHLDSWDLGTGALDDGAGVGIAVAAAKLIRDLRQRPQRTIRVGLFVFWRARSARLCGSCLERSSGDCWAESHTPTRIRRSWIIMSLQPSRTW